MKNARKIMPITHSIGKIIIFTDAIYVRHCALKERSLSGEMSRLPPKEDMSTTVRPSSIYSVFFFFFLSFFTLFSSPRGKDGKPNNVLPRTPYIRE